MHFFICIELPYNDYFEYFGPDFKLHISPTNMTNQNLPDYLEKIKVKLFENLRLIPAAPSVQMQRKYKEGNNGNSNAFETCNGKGKLLANTLVLYSEILIDNFYVVLLAIPEDGITFPEPEEKNPEERMSCMFPIRMNCVLILTAFCHLNYSSPFSCFQYETKTRELNEMMSIQTRKTKATTEETRGLIKNLQFVNDLV